MAELEYLLPVLLEFQKSGRHVNVLYGMPLPCSQAKRLARLASQLGPGSVSVLIDHVGQLDAVRLFYDQSGFAAGIFLKVDTGYHRAGLPPSYVNKDGLVTNIVSLEQDSEAVFIGLYSHSSLSYKDSTPDKAMMNLEAEIKGCLQTIEKHASLFPSNKKLILSVGASPQVTTVEKLAADCKGDSDLSDQATSLLSTIESVQKDDTHGVKTSLELHAGVYALLDVQQLSTYSRGNILGGCEEEIAVSVVAEICSVYNDGERDQPEALAAVGTLGLGREPCESYKGWAVVDRQACGANIAADTRRLIVTRISQEHSIISWEAREDGNEGVSLPTLPLKIGRTIRLYPNHACVTGAMYEKYLVVDSSDASGGTMVVDVWARAHAW